MKIKLLTVAVVLAAAIGCIAHAPVEARHYHRNHFSVGFNSGYVVPARPVYVDTYYPYAPMYPCCGPVYMVPHREVVVRPVVPVWNPGLSFSWNFFR